MVDGGTNTFCRVCGPCTPVRTSTSGRTWSSPPCTRTTSYCSYATRSGSRGPSSPRYLGTATGTSPSGVSCFHSQIRRSGADPRRCAPGRVGYVGGAGGHHTHTHSQRCLCAGRGSPRPEETGSKRLEKFGGPDLTLRQTKGIFNRVQWSETPYLSYFVVGPGWVRGSAVRPDTEGPRYRSVEYDRHLCPVLPRRNWRETFGSSYRPGSPDPVPNPTTLHRTNPSVLRAGVGPSPFRSLCPTANAHRPFEDVPRRTQNLDSCSTQDPFLSPTPPTTDDRKSVPSPRGPVRLNRCGSEDFHSEFPESV